MLKKYKGGGGNKPPHYYNPPFGKAPAGNSTYPDKSGTSTRELLKMAVVTSAYIHKKRTAKLLNLVSWKKVTLPT